MPLLHIAARCWLLCVDLTPQNVLMPPQFWVDFFVFAMVLGAGSTVAAADVLAMPQSTVSRKYRTFARSNGLTVLGKSGSYRLPPGSVYYSRLTDAFIEYRHSTGQYSYVLSCSDELSRHLAVSGTDYAQFPGFALFAPALLPWMKSSRILDFSLCVENTTDSSDRQITIVGEFSPLSDVHLDEVGSFLRGFPFQFRDLVSR